MPDFSLIATRARSDQFRAQVLGALVYKARQVYVAGEDVAGPAAFNYALSVLREVGQYQGVVAWTLSTDPLIIGVPLATPISDADMETAMNRTWPALVGIRA